MKTALALLLGFLVAIPAYGADFVVSDGKAPSLPEPPVRSAVDCITSQNAIVNSDLGIPGQFGPQGPCLPGDPGQPGNLIGFSFPLSMCQDGFVKTTRVHFNRAEAGDLWRLYLWRDNAGLPVDACGLECGVALNPRTITVNGPTVQEYDWILDQCPCLVFQGERLHVGVVYVNGPAPQLSDWTVGRNSFPVGMGFAYGNTTGNHGAWADMASFGFGNRWGVSSTIGPECGVIAVEPSTWGKVKSLYY